MKALCIDPGTKHSGVVVFDGKNIFLNDSEYENNRLEKSITGLKFYDCELLLIEMVECYGMPVGKEVFETCTWIGIFEQAFGREKSKRISVRDVKLYLCNNMRAKPPNIRQAILDKYPSTGGGKTPQIGTIKQPGPLYGMSSHSWSALALGITHFGA